MLRRLLPPMLAALAAWALLGLPAASAGPAPVATVTEQGYLTMADGTDLAYTVVRPEGDERVPTLFEYSGYNPGRSPDSGYIERFVEGSGDYAYIGVNLRGTGCSEGSFDFFQPQEAKDGAAVVEWITDQAWSDGHVGMIGKSYPGITQLFVAAEDPDGLDAIAPGHFFADAYRDVARPGGIANHGFATLWSFIARPSYEVQDSPQYVLNGDYGCSNGLTSEFRSLHLNPYAQLLQHPYDDALVKERSPGQRLDDLLDADIPMLATLAWQDEQLASRQTHLLAALDHAGSTSWWATLTNGDHGMSRTARELDDLERFYDHFLLGEDNGWGDRPRVEVWWESGRDGPRAPGWVTELDHWSEDERGNDGALEPWALALRSGGALTDELAAADETSSSYAYVPIAGSQGVGNPAYGYGSLPNRYLWDVPPPEGTAAHFTTAPMSDDVTLLGSASLDLWLSTPSTDVDLQVTLTEVRPDGQEEFVQQGWLRASQRALDPARSTELLPHQTHAESDVAMLAPDEPVLARVEVFPFGHLLRQGSRLRVWIEAPTFLPQLWAFTPTPVPTPVTVLHDADHPSRLVLPLVPNDPERIDELPACGLVIRQPCRPDPLAAGAGGSDGASDGGTDDAGADSGSDSSNGQSTDASTGESLPATGGAGSWPLAAVVLVVGLAARHLTRAWSMPS